jgi:3-deoxy-manno-octulosonate cytidylyltransferase (CMP-KDO synthetase)
MNIGIIPARLNSTRLPNKILCDISGKPMIAHVMDRALKSTKLDKVVLGVDSKKTIDQLSNFDFEIFMTSDQHVSGTDRVNEVVKEFPDAKIIINIQGDEPLLEPKMIDDLVTVMENSQVEMSTVLSNKLTVSDLLNPNVVKAIMDESHNVVEFKRNVFDLEIGGVYKHIGMYGFKPETLSHFTSLEVSEREAERNLEQMRALDNNIPIRAMITSLDTLSVDTKEDLDAVIKILNDDNK